MSDGTATSIQQVLASQEPAGEAASKDGQPSAQDAPKTYTEAEWAKREADWNKRYGGLDTKLTNTSNALAALQKQYDDALQSQQQFTDDAYIKAVEADGGDVDLAKKTVQREKTSRDRELTLARREVEVAAKESFYATLARQEKAHELIKTYGLEESEFDALMAQETPVAMENYALKAVVKKKESDAIPAQKVDVAGQRSQGADLSQLSTHERLVRILEANSAK